ncbi:MAG: class I SAM-dependent methyltransferase [Planctomycetaceae bacterium]
MEPLTTQAHRFVREALRPGDVVVDATAGNGHDTLFLAEIVGPKGRVYSCDIQPLAVARTAERLHVAGHNNVTLWEMSHVELTNRLPGELRGELGAVMWNLGYLPGGDKSITTQRETTLLAVADLLDWLRPGGVCSILAYPGHPAGRAETDGISHWLQHLDASRFSNNSPAITPHPSPVHFQITRRQTGVVLPP